MNERHLPEACPICDGHLVVTHVSCVECGTELVGDFGHYVPDRATTPTPAGFVAPTASTVPSAREQILARVAAGELDPQQATALLGALEDFE
jgi:hypothetical protein